ncbi:MAG: hypothetical protein V2A70_00385 [Candidatus Omnitrophota bacterium]
MKRIVGVALMVLLLISCLAHKTPSRVVHKDNTRLTRAELLKIAFREAEKEHVDLMYKTVVFDIDNKFWKRRMNSDRQQEPSSFSHLDGRDYQAVCFSPVEILSGKDIWFLIDSRTGAVLGRY